MYKAEIVEPGSSKENAGALACCMAAEKASSGPMVFAYAAANEYFQAWLLGTPQHKLH